MSRNGVSLLLLRLIGLWRFVVWTLALWLLTTALRCGRDRSFSIASVTAILYESRRTGCVSETCGGVGRPKTDPSPALVIDINVVLTTLLQKSYFPYSKKHVQPIRTPGGSTDSIALASTEDESRTAKFLATFTTSLSRNAASLEAAMRI